MDQVRTILAWLKKQHFWVLSVLIALIGIFCWWSASGTMSKKFEQNKSQITGQFSSVSSVQSDPFHPNQTIFDKQEEERQKQAKEVFAVWKDLYDRQTEQVLEWPEQLSPEFREFVETIQFGEEIPQHLRNNYRDYADRYFPKLPAIIGARPLREDEMGLGGGSMPGGRSAFTERGPGFNMGAPQTGEEDENYICEWLDQQAVREELDFPERPTAMRIWVTQEDLWVYKALLISIKNVNDAAGATRLSNSAIRTIVSLEVGQRAAGYSRTPNRIYKVPVAAAPAGDMMMEPTEMGVEGGVVPEGPSPGRTDFGGARSGDGTMSEAEEKNALLTYRYLDAAGKPIPLGGGGGGEGMEAMPAEPVADVPIDPAMFGKEYKQLPIRMNLEMDQRRLPDLIAQLASQSLQVEVKEVRVNPADGGGTSGGGFSGGGSFEGRGGGFGGGGFGGGTGGANFPDRSGILEFKSQPHMANVIIQGVIYIFNKPDPSIVETTGDAELAATTN